MDQLLFGTILFTLLAFLFPTVLVYYAFFATVRSSYTPLNMEVNITQNFRFVLLFCYYWHAWNSSWPSSTISLSFP